MPEALLGKVIGTEIAPAAVEVVLPVEVTANLMNPTSALVLPSTVTETNSEGEKVPLLQLNVTVAPGVMTAGTTLHALDGG